MKKILIVAAIALVIYWLYYRKKANNTAATPVAIIPTGTWTSGSGQTVTILPGSSVINSGPGNIPVQLNG